MKKSIFRKLVGSYIIFFILFLATLAICLILAILSSVGGDVMNFTPEGHIGENGELIHLDSITNFGGWVEELDSEGNVVNIYGAETPMNPHYSSEIMMDVLSLTGNSEYFAFCSPADEKHNTYLFLYPRNSFRVNLTLDMNGQKGSAANKKLNTAVVIFFLLMIAEIFGISHYLRKKIKKPLAELAKGMERIQSGEENVILDIKTEAEFEQIVNTFNTMTTELSAQKQANKELVDQKNQLLLDLSHDLRTPIATIKSCANALEAGLVPQDKLEEYYSTIEKKADRVQILAEDMFFMLRSDNPKDQLHPEKTDICEYVRQLCVEHYDEIENAGFEFEIEIPEDSIYTEIDQKLFSRVISNLLTNAVKYNQTGHTIGAEISAANGRPIIRIWDDGEAIDEELAKNMFSPFVRGDKTRKSVGGTGLGLPICKVIVEKHKGTLEYKRNGDKNVFEIII